jgi:hypothetical protein
MLHGSQVQSPTWRLWIDSVLVGIVAVPPPNLAGLECPNTTDDHRDNDNRHQCEAHNEASFI